MIVFLDTNALIYLIEANPGFSDSVRRKLAAIGRIHPQAGIALSRLTSLECRVGPMKANNPALLAVYDAFFARPDLVWVELTKDVVDLATVIRAKTGLRTPDALQAACCLQLGSEHMFLTGDGAFAKVAGLKARILSP